MNIEPIKLLKKLRIPICIFLSLFLCGCDYLIHEEEYKNLDEAQSKDAVLRGWVPDYLPSTATQIKEMHDLDTNELWGEFKFDSKKDNLSKLLKVCKQMEPKNVKFPSIGIFWKKPHEDLKQKVKTGYTIYNCKQHEFIALNNLGKGFFWYAWYDRYALNPAHLRNPTKRCTRRRKLSLKT